MRDVGRVFVPTLTPLSSVGGDYIYIYIIRIMKLVYNHHISIYIYIYGDYILLSTKRE